MMQRNEKKKKEKVNFIRNDSFGLKQGDSFPH